MIEIEQHSNNLNKNNDLILSVFRKPVNNLIKKQCQYANAKKIENNTCKELEI